MENSKDYLYCVDIGEDDGRFLRYTAYYASEKDAIDVARKLISGGLLTTDITIRIELREQAGEN